MACKRESAGFMLDISMQLTGCLLLKSMQLPSSLRATSFSGQINRI